MNTSEIFLIGIAVTAASSFAVVIYLRPHLKTLLAELCGTQDRAAFWTAFSNVTLLLVPVIFALHVRPEAGAEIPAIFEISSQCEWALIGLVVSVVVMGFVLASFIPRLSPKG